LQLGLGLSIYYTGSINEVIRYESHVADDTRKMVEGYLARKWKARILPIEHPYSRLSPAMRLVSVDGIGEGTGTGTGTDTGSGGGC
jgi:hypothetical protein